MYTTDPILKAEEIVKNMNERAGRYAQPVLRRYPLLFSFLIFFSAAAILHGFEMVTEETELFQEHPFLLIVIGAASLFLTGMLYKVLGKNNIENN